MSRSIAIAPPLRAGREQQVHSNVWPGLVLALVAGALVLVIAQSTMQGVQEAFAGEAGSVQAVQSFPGALLPREWRWERGAMTFDDMVRQSESPGRLRWLRDTPYRTGGGPEH
jgi:hypothetical protein